MLIRSCLYSSREFVSYAWHSANI